MIMQALLGLIIRIFGLCLLCRGIYEVYYSLLEEANILSHPSTLPAYKHSFYGLFYWCVGCGVVAFADRIVKWAYKIKVEAE
jgi:hypothetical protein